MNVTGIGPNKSSEGEPSKGTKRLNLHKTVQKRVIPNVCHKWCKEVAQQKGATWRAFAVAMKHSLGNSNTFTQN